EVLPFKTGSFAAVAETSAVILPVYLRPVAINGQRAVGPVRSAVTWAGGNEPLVQNLRRILSLRSMDMEVCLGTAFSADHRNRKELAEAARARVIALRDQERRMDTFVG